MSDSDTDGNEDRKEDLESLKDTVDSKAYYAGFTESLGGASTQPGDYRAAKINDEGTWSGPLADDKAVVVKDAVQAVADAFTGLSEDLQAAINHLS